MAGNKKTYYAAVTGAMAPSAGLPCRLYTTGSNPFRVIRATGAEDGKVVGIIDARQSVPTGVGVAIPLITERGTRFFGNVSTTVSLGQKLKINNAKKFIPALTAAVDFCAICVAPRTNTGLTELEFVPGGKV
jgi:hypothetical protein